MPQKRSRDGGCRDEKTWYRALNAVQLSGYFLTQDDWVNAHRCLAAAEVVLLEGMRALGMSQSCSSGDDDEYSVRGRMRQASANIGWGWGKLYKCKLEAGGGGGGGGGAVVTPVHFPGILSAEPDAHARALESAHVSYDMACDLIKKGLAGFGRAHAFYALDGFVTDHCTIAHDISGMYRTLCRYTHDDATKSKLHKRRMDIIVPLANALNPAAFCDMYRVLCATPAPPSLPAPAHRMPPPFPPSLCVYVPDCVFIRCFEAAEAAKDRCSPELQSPSVFYFS